MMKKSKQPKSFRRFVWPSVGLAILVLILWQLEILPVWSRIIYYRLFYPVPAGLQFTFIDCNEADRYREQINEKRWLSDDTLYLNVTKSFDCGDIYYFGDYLLNDQELILTPMAIGYPDARSCKCPVTFEYTITGLPKKDYLIQF